jgi:arginase family enzyme
MDAHTDLLSERLGVKYCFATWSYHANELLGRNGKLIQLGIRVSRYDRSHWEGGLGVQQFWADECNTHPDRVLAHVDTYLREQGISEVYFSNDIDGTDASFASATGTPEIGGLSPEFVKKVIQMLGKRIIAGDVMEVAPDLAPNEAARETTLRVATQYLKQTIAAALDDRGLAE